MGEVEKAEEKSKESMTNAAMENLVADVRAFGRMPCRSKGATPAEQKLAQRLANARQRRHLSVEQEEEFLERGISLTPAERFMEEVRARRKYPSKRKGATEDDVKLFHRLDGYRRRGALTPEHEAELASMRVAELGSLEEMNQPPDPMAALSEENSNKLEQDLMMFSQGIRDAQLQRRVRHYRGYVTDSALQERPEVPKLSCSFWLQLQVSPRMFQGFRLRATSCVRSPKTPS